MNVLVARPQWLQVIKRKMPASHFKEKRMQEVPFVPFLIASAYGAGGVGSVLMPVPRYDGELQNVPSSRSERLGLSLLYVRLYHHLAGPGTQRFYP